MSRRPKRSPQGPPSTEGSWRIVEGEHDSFDTSIAPLSQGPSEGGSFRAPVSSGSALPSQLSTVPSDGSFARGPVTSQGAFSLGSQDSIRDFSRHEEDENLILREPFRPSLRVQATGHGAEEMQLRMPMVDVFPSGTNPASTRTSERNQQHGLRARLHKRGPHDLQDSSDENRLGNTRASHLNRIFYFVVDTASWLFDNVTSVVQMLRWQPALLLGICVSIGVLIVSPGLHSTSASVLFSPICRLDGLPLVSLPFCPSMNKPASCNRAPPPPAEFQDLVHVQDGFERLLERSRRLNSLPRKKTFFLNLIYDLKRLVSISDLPRQHEVAAELHQYWRLSQSLIQQIHAYDVKLGDVIDSIINHEHWTCRQISLISSPPGDEAEALLASSGGVLTRWANWWPFRPFHPFGAGDQETKVRNAYTQLATYMSLEIGTLTSTAEAALLSLERGRRILEDTDKLLANSSSTVSDSGHSVLFRLWTRLVGGNRNSGEGNSDPRVLLRRATDQQDLVAGIMTELVTQLQTMQTDLNQLRDKISQQQTQLGVSGDIDSVGHGSGGCDVAVRQGVPLDRQLEILKAGLERLGATKDRIRGKEYGIPRISLQERETTADNGNGA